MDQGKRPVNQDFIEFVRKRREELGLTQAELAKRAGVGQPYISKIESGVIRGPSTSTIDALAEALEVDINHLLWVGAIPDDGEVGYCPYFQCPGSNYEQNLNPLYWEPYKTSLEDEDGRIEFCVHCGTKLLTECENCGRKMKRFYRYCPGCGQHLLRPLSGASDVPF